MAFPESFIQELTERSDIVEVVSGYVRLSRRSGANLFGLCPFHSEKTPSFSVSPDKQIYHCFGCGKGGGVINFIMEIENLSFPEAVEFLARRAGMPLPEQTDSKQARRRSRLLELNREAAKYFYSQLTTPQGQAAQDYMRRRQISPRTARSFGLGFAPDGWEGLCSAMEEKGFTHRDLEEVGLARRGKRGGVYDTFRNRLMFPVIDVRGDVIGFSGRILGDGEPKYMNSPESLVFNKSRNLFALNLAKRSKCGYIILSEGNIDVAMLHQAGFDSAVASLGTSLTPEQARLLSRYTGEVIIAYDNDSAGIKASQRAIGILEKLDLKVRVLELTGAKDPDEFIKLKGPEAFRALLEGSADQIDYRLAQVLKGYDLGQDDQRVAYVREASGLIARLPGPVERQVYAMRVSTQARVPEEVVTQEVARQRKQLLGKARSSQARQETRPKQQAPPGGEGRPRRYTDPASAMAEMGLVRLLYLEPELAGEPELPSPEDMTDPGLRNIYSAVLERAREGRELSASSLAPELSSQEMSQLVALLQEPEDLSRSRESLRDYIERIARRKRESQGPKDLRALAESFREKKGYEG